MTKNNKEDKDIEDILDDLFEEDDVNDSIQYESVNNKDNLEPVVTKTGSNKGKSINKKERIFSSPSNVISKYNLKVASYIMYCLVTFMIVCFIFMYAVKEELINGGAVGSKAVKLLYQFDNISELEKNLDSLSSIMTKEAYNNTTVINSDKSLNSYLKFNKQRTTVNILERKPGFILYSINNPNITSTRLFIFSYDLNIFGKIENVREFEAIDFYSTYTSDSIDVEDLDKLIEDWNSEQ